MNLPFGSSPDTKGEPSEVPHQQGILRRVRRREKLFADGCSCHNTATAVAALGGFLYILAEYHPDNGDAHPEYYPNHGDPYSSSQSPASNYQDGAAGPDVQRTGRPLSVS